MSGMVEVIAAHNGFDTHWDDRFGSQVWYVVCDGCDWQQDLQDAPATDHAAHVADELAKAGFGNTREAIVSAADKMEKERATWCLDDTGRYWIGRTLNELREEAA